MQSKRDKFKKINIPLFFGLSHLGQVFSLCWSKKIGNCYVYDNNKKALSLFKEGKYTVEEPNLNKLNLNKIKFLKKFEDIKNFKYIFFTLDTPLNIKNGKPELKKIYQNLEKILNFKFKEKTYLIISSQINPEVINNLKEKIHISKNIKIFYLVDTLKMGEALNKFLKPDQIIIGGDKYEKKNILKLFKKFKTKKFYVDLNEAIITKMAINIYLSFSVTFANFIDDLCRQYASNYFKIIDPLRNDNRIGQNSYINPSLGFSGGHLERDLFYLKEISKNKVVKKTITNILNFNDKAINKLKVKNFIKRKKIINTLVVGKSYKKNSFSEVNSIFNKLNKKFKLNFYDDIFFKYNNPNKKLIELIKKNDLIIYNYSSIETINKILNLSQKNNKEIINIGYKRLNSKKYRNLINLFSI